MLFCFFSAHVPFCNGKKLDGNTVYSTNNKNGTWGNKMKNQAFNPYLPSWEYIPDGEPHLFDGRLYIYGSHDRFNGTHYCMNDYVCWSAPAADLSEWCYEGVIYRPEQDPNFNVYPNPFKGTRHCLYAPDVTKGPDGRYYLYYALDFAGVISVAAADNPAGPFEFFGDVHHKDGTLYGKRAGDEFAFDPAVFTDDDGKVWLYSGFGSAEICRRLGNETTETGCDCIELEPDMITIRTEPVKIIPGRANGKGSPFEGHEFYEASSMRKFDGKYYFIYSSMLSHELAYAVSEEGPDRGFVYGGPLHSNGNIGYGDCHEAQCYWGNNHGSIERVAGKFYVFGHRQTNYHEFSRQGVAEEIRMDENGRFEMAEMTSCGLNGGPLNGSGTYEARIACVLKAKEGACKINKIKNKDLHPSFTQTGEDRMSDPDQYICNLNDGSTAGFKYFKFENQTEITVRVKADTEGIMEVRYGENEEAAAFIHVAPSAERIDFKAELQPVSGVYPLFFTWKSEGRTDFFSFSVA